MTRTRHDLFAKQYFAALLAPFGTVHPNHKLISETREADLLFIPRSITEADRQALGLLGRMLSHRYLFEAFRNPANVNEINSCIGKLNSDREHLLRIAKREKRKLQEQDQPRLAILSPTLSEKTLTAFHAIPDPHWAEGVYQLGGGLRTWLIAVHQLPVNRDTLWFRLVGRNGVQREAIAELLALPQGDRLRQQAIEHLSILRINLEIRDNLGKDERELIMNFNAVYETWRQEALAGIKREAIELAKQDIQVREEVKQEVEQEVVLRLLSRRVGILSDEVRSQITQLSIAQLDELAEALLDFAHAEDLTAWLQTQK
jgi:hypothetical protein